MEISGALAYEPFSKQSGKNRYCVSALRINDNFGEYNQIRIYGKNSRADELAKLKIGDQVKIIGHLRINQTKREVEVGVDDLVRVYTVDQVAKMEFERLYPRDLSAVASPLTT